MRAFRCDHHEVPLPAGHRFPMEKYARLREALLAERVLAPEDLAPSPLAPWAAIEAVHDADYVRRFATGTLAREEVVRLGFPWSEALVRRCRASVGGTLAAAEAALADGIAGHLAGGTHHAHADFGAGYCAFNDIAVAAVALLEAGAVARVLVVDLDVHQGDGTAALFADDPRVFTCSVHGERNFPLRKTRGDLDVALPDGTSDAAYLDAVEAALERALAGARADIVFFQAGVDPLAEDRLGRLAVSADGLRARDRLVIDEVRGRDTPLVLTLGGGYADPIELSIAAHVETYRAARAALRRMRA